MNGVRSVWSFLILADLLHWPDPLRVERWTCHTHRRVKVTFQNRKSHHQITFLKIRSFESLRNGGGRKGAIITYFKQTYACKPSKRFFYNSSNAPNSGKLFIRILHQFIMIKKIRKWYIIKYASSANYFCIPDSDPISVRFIFEYSSLFEKYIEKIQSKLN